MISTMFHRVLHRRRGVTEATPTTQNLIFAHIPFAIVNMMSHAVLSFCDIDSYNIFSSDHTLASFWY